MQFMGSRGRPRAPGGGGRAAVLPLFVLLLLLLLAAALAPGAAAEDGGSKLVPGLDVTKATINATLAALPADARVLFEFYATWCPACRNFKPEYDKVAAFMGAVPEGAPNKVYALRLDCAVDADVCGTFQVSSFPTLYVGAAPAFAAADVARLTKFDYGRFTRDAPGVVKFAAEHFKVNLVYVEAPPAPPPPDTTPPGARGETKVAPDLQWTLPDVQLATKQLFDSIAAQPLLTGTGEQRAALQQLLQVWADAHPAPACRAGAAEALAKLPALWPPGSAAPAGALAPLSVCGDCSETLCSGGGEGHGGGAAAAVAQLAGAGQSKAPGAAGAGASADAGGAHKLGWVACKGTRPEGRGFTCGLWMLFHTTAARHPNPQLFMSSVKGFAHHFFQCEVCKRHFERMADAPEASAVRDTRGAVLWVWRAHNEVNARLQVIESKYGHSSTGDAAFPKVQWPTRSACPACRLPTPPPPTRRADERGGGDGGRRTGEGDRFAAGGGAPEEVAWNEDEVYRFLQRWYGGNPGTGLPEPVGLLGGGGGRGFEEEEAAAAAAAAAAGAGAGGAGLEGAVGAGPGGNLTGLLVLFAVAAAVFYWYSGGSLSGRRRHGPGPVKGPGAMLLQHGRHHGGAKHGGGGGGGGAAANGGDWGPRLPMPSQRKASE